MASHEEACIEPRMHHMADCKLLLQAQVLTVQFLTVPSLLTSLSCDCAPALEKAPLLASGQDVLCRAFASWLSLSRNDAYGASGLTAGHGPAVLGFAAVVTLAKDIPGFSGKLKSDVA